MKGLKRPNSIWQLYHGLKAVAICREDAVSAAEPL